MKRSDGFVDLLLIATVCLWALTVVAARYALTNGVPPLAFTAMRQVGSSAIIVGICLGRERAISVPRSTWRLVGVAIALGFANQVFFVYAVRTTSASTVGLMLGTVPIITMLIATAIGFEALSRRGALAAGVSFAGVALISTEAGQLAGGARGSVLALATAASWAAYSVAIARLARDASPLRLSAVVMVGYAPLLIIVAAPQLIGASYANTTTLAWACVVGVAVAIGIATPLWFYSIDRVGPSRATVFANLQPFVVVVLGVLLLDEVLSPPLIMGGAAIAAGLALAWRRGPPPVID